MKKQITQTININLSSKPIAMITEDLVQHQAEQILGRLLSEKEISVLRYGGFWNNDIARQFIFDAVEIAVRMFE